VRGTRRRSATEIESLEFWMSAQGFGSSSINLIRTHEKLKGISIPWICDTGAIVNIAGFVRTEARH
jgi:hypothetical protein